MAFWPFSSQVNAQSVSRARIIHDPSIRLLVAAVNIDPNPVKRGDIGTFVNGSALMAGVGPAGTLLSTSDDTFSQDKISVYVVRYGDTLSEIARMFGVSVNTIVWANDLGSDRAISPGQSLIILPISGIEHTVSSGDTLKSIAKKYGGNADEIAEYNNTSVSAKLAVNTVLIIPGGEVSRPTTSSVKTSSHSQHEHYLGGNGVAINGYYTNPVVGAVLTQGVHGWNAVDLGAKKGTPVYAAASGKVIIVRSNGAWNGGYGNYIVISHANGTQTLYSHMSRVANITQGSFVSAGQTIGYVGSTGLSTGAHLHFEVRGAKNPFASCPTRAVCQPQ